MLNLGQLLRDLIQQDADLDPDDLGVWEARYGGLCDRLEVQDRHLIRQLKLTARAGVMVFESYEQETIRQGGGRLIEVLQAFPTVMESYYSQVTEKLNI